MPASATCPECDAPFAVTAALKGKKVRCKQCRHVFVVGAAPADRGPTRRPTRRPRDDAADRPRRKKAGRRSAPSGLLLGLVGLGAALLVGVGVLVAGFALGWFAPTRPAGDGNTPVAQLPDKDAAPKDGRPKDGAPKDGNPPPPPPAGPLQAPAVRAELRCPAMVFRRLAPAPEAKVVGVYNWVVVNADTQRHLFHRYDAVTGSHLGEIEPQGFGGNSDVLSLSPDGKLLAAIQHKAVGHTVWVWDAATGEAVIGNDWQPFPRQPGMNLGHPDTTLAWIQFLDPGRLMVLSNSGLLAIWTVPQRQQVGVTRLLPPNVSATCAYGTKMPKNFAVSPDRKTLALANGDGFDLVDLATGRVTRKTASFGEKTPPLSGFYTATAFSPDGGKLLCHYPAIRDGGPGLSTHDAVAIWDVKAAETPCPKVFGFDVVRDGKIGAVGPTRNGDGLFTPGPMVWWGDGHLVLLNANLNQGHLIDLASGRYTVCLLSDRLSGHLCPQPADGRLWYVASPGQSAPGVLVALDAPAEAVAGQTPRAAGQLAGQAYLAVEGVRKDASP